MNPTDFLRFEEIWFVDFEFVAAAGERPLPVCLVAHELRSGKIHRLFQDELEKCNIPPYGVGKENLFVAYYATAELTCHLTLGWKLPENVLDLYVEFKNLTNGLKLDRGAGLLGAMSYFGLDSISVAEKEEMRQLVMRGGPWTEDEKFNLLNYCETDVEALPKLLLKMLPRIDLPRSLLRGRYMKAVAEIEHRGVPLDVEALTLLRNNWDKIKDRLIGDIDSSYGVYEGQSFKRNRFEEYLVREKIPWPRKKDSGELDLEDETFRQMARSHPQVAALRELRASLSKMRLSELPVGRDGRNRTLLSPFRSRTSRCQPSNNKFIFGPSKWLRSLIQPKVGHGLVYLDWSQQEFGIAGALSGDSNMIEAYTTGDPYLAFAKQAGAVPKDATKKSHEAVRDLYKACALAVLYGMGEESLAVKIGQPIIVARQLIRMHREIYQKFWSWSDSVVDQAMIFGSLPTTFGWTIHADAEANPRFLRNFPMQGNGAEMLRLACIFASERGVQICATVHDAILIEAPLGELDAAKVAAQAIMSDASAVVLNGFRLNSDAKVICYPDRYWDKGGIEMWNRVWELIGNREYQLK